jgi:hypothetical protein
MRHVILFVLLVGTAGSAQEPATARAGRTRTGQS